MAAPTWQDYYDTGKTEAILRRPELSVFEGDISDMLIAGSAAMADRLTGYAADRFRATYLDGAENTDLDNLTTDHWSLTRQPAVKSTVLLTFTRPTNTFGGFVMQQGSIFATVPDAAGNTVQFVLDSDLTWGSELSKTAVAATAAFAGQSGNVSADTITTLITPTLDTSVTVTNPAVAAGGADAELDDALRERVRQLPNTLRRGTMDALEYGALQVAGVANATAVEDSSGLVTVYISDIDGNSNPTLVANVTTEMENWRAAGALVTVSGGSLYYLTPIDISLTVRTGVDVSSGSVLVANIKAAIKARLDKLAMGETAYRSLIRSAAMTADPNNILEVTVNSPAGDVVPTSSQLIRTATTEISVS